jgi:hypothetical protein
LAIIDNLVAYWKLDAASGNESDSHGSNTLTQNGTVGTAAGKIGSARTGSGGAGGNHLSRADNADLSAGDIDFTVQAWAYLADKADPYAVLGKWSSAAGFEYLLYFDNAADRWKFAVTSDGSVGTFAEVAADTFGSPSTATFYLLHAWHDAANNQLGIAVNAGAADTLSHSAGVYDGATDFVVLGHADNGIYSGRIDEVGLWKRVLPSADRTSLYGAGAGLAYPFAEDVYPGVFFRPLPPVRRRARVLAY